MSRYFYPLKGSGKVPATVPDLPSGVQPANPWSGWRHAETSHAGKPNPLPGGEDARAAAGEGERKTAPLPWQMFVWGEVIAIAPNIEHPVCVINPNGSYIKGPPKPEDLANANLILQAVNSHQALIQALQFTNCDTEHDGFFCNCPREDGTRPDADHATSCLEARKALAMAGQS